MKAKCNNLGVILGLYCCNLLPRFLNSCLSFLHFYYYCRSHCNSVIGEVGLWRPRGLLRLKPLWRTLDPVREEWSYTPSLPSESLRTSASAPPRQDESWPRSAHQNSSNVPYSERRRDHFSACPWQEQKRNMSSYVNKRKATWELQTSPELNWPQKNLAQPQPIPTSHFACISRSRLWLDIKVTAATLEFTSGQPWQTLMHERKLESFCTFCSNLKLH